MTTADLEKLSGPHVARNWFLDLDLPTGRSYLHSGAGRITMDGKEWRGISDPIGGRLVSLDGIEEARFGQATAITITLSGANRAFLKSVHDTALAIEGREAILYFSVFDTETAELLLGPQRMFPGKMTAPEIIWGGIGMRTVSITIESRWAGQNYPFLGMWSPAGQRKRFPFDKGLDRIGIETAEIYA